MTNLQLHENWVKAPKPAKGDRIRLCEPIWAAPNKPRGKRDQIGEQIIEATVLEAGEFYVLEVINAEAATPDLPINVKSGDIIRRKSSSIAKSGCHKKLGD